MHIADPSTGNLGANAIVGGGAGIATGAAFAAKYLGQPHVSVCFFGEGALGQGVLYEEMNLAQLWKLPVIFVCENNLYNEYTHCSETTAGEMRARPAAFGIATVTRSTGRTCAPCTPRQSTLSLAGDRAAGRPFCSAIRIATTVITSAT